MLLAVVAMTAVASIAGAQSKVPPGGQTKAAANGKGNPATQEQRDKLQAARQDLQKDQNELKRLEADMKRDRENKNEADLKRDQQELKKLKADIQKDRDRIKSLEANHGKK
jgi:septal ring factor EnvC (AmiA/AmiB activator)